MKYELVHVFHFDLDSHIEAHGGYAIRHQLTVISIEIY